MCVDTIRVLLADDHPVVRAGVKAVLAAAKDMAVVGEASTGAQAIAMCQRCDPDVVVLDIDMPEGDGLEVTKAIAARGPRPRVLVFTRQGEEGYLLPILRAGAAGFVVKTAAEYELIDAVRGVAHGDAHVRIASARLLAQGLAHKNPADALGQAYKSLSPRERDVFGMIAEGYTAPEIATKLSISAKTVDTYKQRINDKLRLSHRAEYVRTALKLGVLSVP